tara:strand:- start:122 stop:544 length:423 start_codon:yes stop_codon:yes gene_type:complete
MIKYNLKCHNNHEFESWFADSKEFEKLKKRKLLECIYCSSQEISKSIMAPMVSVAKDRTYNLEFDPQMVKEEKVKLRKIQKYIEKNFEYVGENFSKRVREIYYDKKSNKTIYGITTPQEREELKDEGIDLISIPWVDKEN